MARFIVVDDDPVVRHILGAILESIGHELVAFSEGAPALAFLRQAKQQNQPPVLAFLDFQLAEMTGIDLLTEIRKLFDHTILPAAMLSANSRDEVLAAGSVMMPDYFLSKPFTLEDIQSLLQTAGIGAAQA